MISTDYAPNEEWVDALNALYRGFKPWTWRKGQYLFKAKQRLKRYFPGQEVCFFFTGRAALYKTLQALQLKEGSEILVCGFTCEAVVLPILELGLKPVFVDIELSSFSFDPEDLKRKMSPRSRVVIMQHTFGITPIKRKEILAIAKKNHLTVCEDLAHGFDDELMKKDKEDTIKLLSFGRSKAISSVFGGGVACKDRTILQRLKTYEKGLPFPHTLRIEQALFYKTSSFFIKLMYDAFVGKLMHRIIRSFGLIPNELSAKERGGHFDNETLRAYPNALANLLFIQLKKFDRIQKKRLSVCEKYNMYFHNVPKPQPLGRYPLMVNDPDGLRKKLKQKNIYIGRWYSYVQSPEGECPQAELLTNRIVNLPTTISSKQADQIITSAAPFYEQSLSHN